MDIIWGFTVNKLFQIATIVASFFSYCNAAIYRADVRTSNGCKIYCLYDWHKCVDESINMQQQNAILAATKQLQAHYGKNEVVVIGEDSIAFDPQEKIFDGINQNSKDLITAMIQMNKDYGAWQGCAIDIGSMCALKNIPFCNVDFRHCEYAKNFGYEISSQDIAIVCKNVRSELEKDRSTLAWVQSILSRQNSYEYRDLLEARLVQKIIQNLHKKCIIVVTGGAHIENIHDELQKLGQARSYGIVNGDMLVTQKDEYEDNCLCKESVFDVGAFFTQEIQHCASARQPMQFHHIKTQGARVSVSAQPSVDAKPQTAAQQAPEQLQQKNQSWLSNIFSFFTIKNISIGALCACAFYAINRGFYE